MARFFDNQRGLVPMCDVLAKLMALSFKPYKYSYFFRYVFRYYIYVGQYILAISVSVTGPRR